MAKTDPIDPNVPAGSEDPKLGNDRIQELARAIAEILGIDHYIGADGGAGVGYNEDAAGEHKRVKFNAPLTSDPANEANKFFIYGKDVSSKIELFLQDEDGNVLQLTSAGQFNPAIFALLTGAQTIAGVKTFSSQPSFPAGLTAAAALVSTLATGTAPLTIASTTKVANLNADKVDGYDVSAYTGGQSYTFPGGRIEKQGTVSIAANSGSSVTFATAFPNACTRVYVTPQIDSTSGSLGGLCWVRPTPSTTGFSFYNSIDVTISMNWLAIGY